MMDEFVALYLGISDKKLEQQWREKLGVSTTATFYTQFDFLCRPKMRARHS